MRTWKLTAILALAALFVVGVSVVSAVTTGVVVSRPTPVIADEQPVAPVDTGAQHAAAGIPELGTKPTPDEPAIPELAPRPSSTVSGILEADDPNPGGGVDEGTLEDLGNFLGDDCPGCGMG